MALGEKILELRQERGISQEQLAAYINVSRQAVSKWELNESMPDTSNIIQLCFIMWGVPQFIRNYSRSYHE